MEFAAIFSVLIIGSSAYMPSGEESFLSQDILRELVNRMGKDVDTGYLDFPDGRYPVGSRSLVKELEEEQMYPLDYDTLGETNLHPSLRDQEFLEHSSLWGNQFMSGGAGEGKQLLKPEGSLKNRQEVKTDATLPAYCNPPNPCPLGYSGENGCIENFENTASYSRRYQASQDCMCDTEHMFDCPNPGAEPETEDAIDALNDIEFNRFLQHSMQVDPRLLHKSLVSKKFQAKKSVNVNPFLTGERLPVAAKKGHHVVS